MKQILILATFLLAGCSYGFKYKGAYRAEKTGVSEDIVLYKNFTYTHVYVTDTSFIVGTGTWKVQEDSTGTSLYLYKFICYRADWLCLEYIEECQCMHPKRPAYYVVPINKKAIIFNNTKDGVFYKR